MPTVETKITQAIQARVASIPLSFPVMWTDDAVTALPNEAGEPVPYIEAHHEPNRTVRVLIDSDGAHQRPGILLLTLCWPIAKVGTGSGKTHRNAIRENAGKIAEHFAPGTPMIFEGVKVRVTKASDVLGAYRDDSYLRTQIRVLWEAFA